MITDLDEFLVVLLRLDRVRGCYGYHGNLRNHRMEAGERSRSGGGRWKKGYGRVFGVATLLWVTHASLCRLAGFTPERVGR